MAASGSPSKGRKEGDVSGGVPSPSEDIDAYLSYLQSKLQPPTKLAAQLPGPSDLAFHRSLDRTLAKDLDAAKEDVVASINDIVRTVKSKGKARANDKDDTIALQDLIDPDAFVRSLGDVVDTLLENADTSLDEYQGKVVPRSYKKTADKAVKARDPNAIPALGPLPSRILNANINPLPQTKFAIKPDNSRETTWTRPLKLGKPHAQVSLSWKPPAPAEGDPEPVVGTRQGMYCAEGDPRQHPYYYEINQYHPPPFITEVPDLEALKPPQPLNLKLPKGGNPSFTWVDTAEGMEELLNHLLEERVKEIAVDVEHHNFRSFQGLVCLVQLSTRWGDYIIDALSPAVRKCSETLNRVMADPSKVKILHGAEHDVLWLQRDMGIYLVGLFDTYHATNVLAMPQHGLAYLLQRYVNFEADKRFQLADWRIRPLPDEMLFYARSDTHSLLYVYDCLRFELSKLPESGTGFGYPGAEDAIVKVFELSKKTACKVYAKEEWDPAGEGREGWRTVWKKMGGDEANGIDERWEKEGLQSLNRTERVWRAIHDWRDEVARTEDESPRYVLSAQNMLNLASRAPTTKEAAVGCLGPALQKRAPEVAKVIGREVEAWNKVQEEKATRMKANLENNVTMNSDDEEMGTAVPRDGLGISTTPLWPSAAEPYTDMSSGIVPSSSGSSLASSLFGLTSQHAPVQSLGQPSTLTNRDQLRTFSSSSKTSTASKASLFSQNLRSSAAEAVKSVKMDLTSALRGVLGMPRAASSSGPVSKIDKKVWNGEGNEKLQEPENVAFVPRGARSTAMGVPLSSSSRQIVSSDSNEDKDELNGEEALHATKDKDTSDEEKGEDQVVEVKKKDKKKRKREAKEEDSVEGTRPGVGKEMVGKGKKKAKWTKEMKEARAEEREAAEKNTEPFDYSNATSVLDEKPSSTSSSKKKKDKDGTSKGRSTTTTQTLQDVAPGKERRYANVGSTRDRKGMASGKSMSFAK